MIKNVLHVLALITVIIFHVALKNNSLAPTMLISLPLLSLVTVIFIFPFEYVALWAIGIGLMLEMYSSIPFFLTTLFYIVLAFVINWIYLNLFSNKSLFSFLGLVLVSTAIYTILYSFILWAIIGITQPTYLDLSDIYTKIEHLPLSLFIHAIFAIIIFFVVNALSKTFKSYFVSIKH